MKKANNFHLITGGAFFSDSAWAYDKKTDSYYTKIFPKKMPDLNWDNPKVRLAMFEFKFYLDLVDFPS